MELGGLYKIYLVRCNHTFQRHRPTNDRADGMYKFSTAIYGTRFLITIYLYVTHHFRSEPSNYALVSLDQ